MPKAAKEPAKTTDYIVLAGLGADGTDKWTQVARVSAMTALEAMKKGAAEYLEASGDTPPRFVAIPARSWKPKTRTVEQVMRESWS